MAKKQGTGWSLGLIGGTVVSDALFTDHKLATVSVQAFHLCFTSYFKQIQMKVYSVLADKDLKFKY
jgi:hypothetical protein